MRLGEHLTGLPTELADALELQYKNVMEHFLLGEWDDAQVDAGRYCEAVLRVLQWRMNGRYTALDGKSKPNRKDVVGKAERDAALPPSLRQQVPQAIEMIMDFRNNRNAAHLGGVDANKIDAACVVQLAGWVTGELVRLETNKGTAEVQGILDGLAERQVPMIEMVGETPVVLNGGLSATEKALVLLYNHNAPVDTRTLQRWVEYANTTRWRENLLRAMQKARLIYLDGQDVHLLMPGRIAAEKLLAEQVAA